MNYFFISALLLGMVSASTASDVASTETIPLAGEYDDRLYNYKATFYSIYDGDTMTAMVDVGFEVHVKTKLRLARVNTPEVRGVESVEGKRVRDIVRDLLMHREVMIHTDGKGKYGRWITEIYFENDDGNLINLSDWLLANKYAVAVEY